MKSKCLRTPDLDNSIKDRLCSPPSLWGVMRPCCYKSLFVRPFKDLTFTDMEISCDRWEAEARTKEENKDERAEESGGVSGRVTSASSIADGGPGGGRGGQADCVSIKMVTNEERRGGGGSRDVERQTAEGMDGERIRVEAWEGRQTEREGAEVIQMILTRSI